MRTEYKIDPRLLSWIKKNMGGCPQVPDDLRSEERRVGKECT